MELRSVGDAYVRDEFKRHKDADVNFVPVFMTEWTVSSYNALQRDSQSRWPGVLLAGTTSETRSCQWLHSRLMGVTGIVPGKVIEQPGTVRPAAL